MSRGVCAVEEFSVEELDSDHGENQEEENVDYQDVEHIFQGGNNAVKHSLECGDTVHHLERPENAKQLHRLQLLASGCPSEKKK